MKYLLPLALLTLAACAQGPIEDSANVRAFKAVSPEVTTARHNGTLFIIGSLN